MSAINTDLRRFIFVSTLVTSVLVCIMFFSPFSTDFSDDGASRGMHTDIEELLRDNKAEHALALVDSLIDAKSVGLPRFAYFDRFLSENERFAVANARADIYDLQWLRIMVIEQIGNAEALREALERYSRIRGYNQKAAEEMLNVISCN